ncbi:diguanylate cyclase [Cnuibacter sp. UC19_7]|uniref:GGDEF domain-containing protein n=1 Tax=Cnuibacter sp. UC19_7 TaxID=3350166 RepID=UPI003672110B
MTVDLPSVLLVSGLVIVLCGLIFVLNTAMRRNDASGRVWSVGFISGMLSAICYAMWAVAQDQWWINAIANGTYLLSVAAIWSGSRVFNGRLRSLLWVGLAAGGVAMVLTVIEGPSGVWAGSIPVFVGLTLFAVLTGYETLRSRMRRNLNARVLGIGMWFFALFTLARLVIFLTQGPDSSTFQTYFGTQVATIVTVVLVVLGTVAVSVMQAERSGARALGDVTVGVYSTVGVLSASSFMQQWADQVERAAFNRDRLAMVAMDVDNLPQMNTAFGRNFGDTAIRSVAQLIRHHTPTTAVLGHPGAGRFVIVLVTNAASDAERLAIRLQTALVDEPIDPERSLRATASFGVVDTDMFGYSLPVLRKALDDATASARAQGGNRIVMGSTDVTHPGALPRP